MALEHRYVDPQLESHFASFDSSAEDPLLYTLTSALHDVTPRWSLHEITVLMESREDIELNALDLVPLLWASNDKEEEVFRILKLVAMRASSKECLIALLEAQEDLIFRLSNSSEEEENNESKRLCLLLDLYSAVTPRIILRKKGPLETLNPIITGLSRCIRLCSAELSKKDANSVLQSLAGFISSTSSWLVGVPSTGQMDTRPSMDSLWAMLFTGVASLCNHIHSHLAEGSIEQHFPRKYLHTALSSESAADSTLMARVIEAATSIDLTPSQMTTLVTTSQNVSVVTASIVLLAHWKPPPQPLTIASFIPHLAPFIQGGTSIDEVLFLLLHYAHGYATHSIQATSIDTIIQPLVTLCSTCPDPTQRNTIWVTFSELFKTLPSPARLLLLEELLSPETDPFPQMRVAAVGLVKESVSEALSAAASLTSEQRKKGVEVFASTRLFTQLGRYLLRPEPPELFTQLETFDVDAFLESSEPTRLHQCLSLYYMLLVRDVSNLTGVRDNGSISETRRYLLKPLENVLDLAERRATEKGEFDTMQVINPLRMALIHANEASD